MEIGKRVAAGVMAVAISALSPAGASEGGASLLHLFSKLSPVSLPDDAWSAYSLCLMEAVQHHAGDGMTLNLLIEYVETFDTNVQRIPGDMALRIDRDIIDPCMRYNPIAYIEEKLHTTRH